ncbi:cytochrome b/b6 domain-containing protein [Qipengyuania nanhaisediminis]|uniref:cytochrome b/b6 domain-containing protein n=1 Tax=Qipengyuania nanhaisediminis TaxID=604088 RepID=UPI0038B3BAE0
MRRHALVTRIWHWINALAVVVLFMSGLNISNAHRFLYWGDYGFDPADAWLSVMRFPAWATIPQRYDLAEARDWHNTFAWVFALGLLGMWIASLANRHFQRDIAASASEWSPRSLLVDMREHLRGHFDHGDGRYNSLQKISYGLVLGVLLPLMIVTGLAISPGIEPAMPWLVDALGGRQSARSLHFLAAWALFAFVAVHLVMVILSGPIRQVAAMITGGPRGDAGNG